MLIRYFLRNFFYQGATIFAILTGIFASCNLFLRLPFIHNFASIPLVLGSMIPLMALFSLPLAASLAVFITIAQHKANDQLLTLSLFSSARSALHKAVIIFSLFCSLLYMLFVFQLAPQSYRLGKKLLLKVAKEHFLQLEPNKFHTPLSSFTFFFKNKEHQVFSTLFLVFTSKNERYFFTAQKGFFSGNTLLLNNGSIYTLKGGRFHIATFAKTEIDLQQFIRDEKAERQFSSLKFSTLKNLLSAKTDSEVFIELHKRCAQTLWQFAMPIFAMIMVTLLPQVTLLASVMSCGTVYLMSYVLLALAQSQQMVLALILFYLPLVLLLCMGLLFYRQQIR